MQNVRCPRCGGTQFVDLGSGWFECRSDVPYSGAPPGLTGLPHAVIDFGPCEHRFQPAAVLEAEAERGRRAREEAERRAEAEAVEEALAEARRLRIEASDDPAEILEALQVREGLIPAAILKGAWLRLLGSDQIDAPEEEMITLEGRGTVLGYFLSRGTYTTQWGKWTESEREPVYRARGAGYEVIPGNSESSESVHEGFDVWLDSTGAIWSDGRSSGGPARLAIGNGGGRDTERLVVAKGGSLKLQRRKAEWQGWKILVPGAQTAWPHEDSSIEYTRALKALLS